MKKRILLIPLIILLLTVVSVESTFAALRAEPVPRALFDLRGRYDTDLFTGSASYTYPISVPKGTNDLTPNVSLSYNSSSANSASAFVAAGWDLSRDYIERDVNYSPNNTGDDKFDLRLQGATHDLVYVSADGRYHTKAEANLHISKVTAGEENDSNEYWQVIAPDGTKYRFGQSAQSELMCNSRSYVYRWYLDQVEDTHGNKIFYTYTESNGASYLSKIEYNTEKSRVIDFTYAASPYQQQVYTQGCNIIENQRLTSIQVKTNGSLVRQFDMGYTSASNGRQLLRSITEKGSDGSVLPGSTFDYKQEVTGWISPDEKWIDNADVDVNLAHTNARVMDVNGDGLPDILKSDQNGGSATWKVLMNLGDKWSTSWQIWINNAPIDAHIAHSQVRVIDVTGDNLPDIVKAGSADSWRVLRNTGGSWSTSWEQWGNFAPYGAEHKLDDPRPKIVDVTGDGLADVVTGTDSYWRVFRNMGNSWNGAPEIWSTSGVNESSDSPNILLLDANGDGLTDILKTSHSGTNATWTVYKNTGNSWSASGETWINNAGVDAYLGHPDSTIADVNGDGLPDIVKSDDLGTADRWKVLLNNGNSWSTTWETWIDPSQGLDIDVHSVDNTALIDVTGDGLPDIVKSQQINGGFNTWKVWRNKGKSPNLLSAVHTQRGGTGTFDYMQSSHFDSDDVPFTGEYFANKTLSGSPTLTRTDQEINFNWSGSPDPSIPSDNFSVRWTKTVTLNAGTYVFSATGDDGIRLYVDNELIIDKWIDQGPTNYTASKTLSEGSHSIKFEYYESGGGAVAKLAYQNSYSQGIPFNLWLVEKKTENNGMTGVHGTNDITTYSYENGLYDWQDKEFRGFGTVNEDLPNGTKKKYVFHQDDILKGKFKEIQTRDSQGNPYAETESYWVSTQVESLNIVNLSSEKNYTYDGTAENPKIVQTDYEYDNYGNVTKKSELGDTSVTGDERYTYNEYVYNPALWIVNKLTHSVLKDSDDTTEISQLWRQYDNATASSSGTYSPPPPTSFGDGSDGDLNILINTTETPITSWVSAASGSATASVGLGAGFVPNQIVMLHQTTGTDAGVWELARVQGYNGVTLTFTTPVAHTYSTSGNNKAQIRVVPQYHNVTVVTGATWQPKAWDGTTGGILAFLANGTVIVDGAIVADGRGFRAGNGGNNAFGVQGEGLTGLGTQSNSANGIGGGAGRGAVWFGGGGGAGGGHAVTGGNGNTGGNSGWGGSGGGTGGTANLATMIFGGAGGGGGSYYSNGQGGNGGNSGGIIFAATQTLTINSGGAVRTNGIAGSNSAPAGDSGGGGGGAAGAIFVRAENVTIGSSLLSATGGSGGAKNGSGGVGGAGSEGRIRIEYKTSLTGTTTPTASVAQTEIPVLPAEIINSSSNNPNLTKGDLTKEVRWLEGSTNPETNYTYDSFGNVLSSTDANNHTTTTAYDTTGTYPVSQTNAKSQTTTVSYDLGTGNLLLKTDANNLTTSYEYDVFGRITKEIKPYDTSSLPTLSYQYFVDGTAPEATLVSKREVSGQAGTVDAYTFIDGFGRKIQTQTDAEDTETFILTDTFYDANGEISKQTVPYLASSSGTVTQTQPSTKFGNGSDGNLTISTNTTEAPIDSSVNAIIGTSTAIVDTGLGFAPNQIVMLHQTQGINAGAWEYARVESYSGTTLTFTGPLTNSYSSAGSNRAQIRVVPQYHDVTVNSGVTWTAKAWNGTTGGIFTFLASGTVNIAGSIDGKGKGFRGYPGHGGNQIVGLQGEGISGVGNTRTTGANGNGAGGGGYSNNSPWDQGNGGGGGGNGTVGSSGLTTGGGGNQGGAGGTGGASSGVAELTNLSLGGAGGAGGTGNTSGSSGSGANGGAIVMIQASNVILSGSINLDGNRGGNSSAYKAAGGGGGAGGALFIKTQTASLGNSLITVLGGAGGYHENASRTDALGGAGAAGRVRINYETSLTGTTNPAASTLQTQISLLPGAQSIPTSGTFGAYATPDSTARYTEMTYDALGRVTIVKNPKGDSKTTAYDHWKETTIDEEGHIKRQYRNAYDKIVKVEEVNGLETYETTYEYNARDELTKITDDAGNEFEFVYDTLGRRTSQIDPDMGTWTYTYDGVDNLLTKKDNRDITTTYTYDELDRKTLVNHPTDTDVTYTYDGNGKIGTLTSITDKAGTLTFTYDDRLRKISETRVIDGNSWTTQFAYDSADRLVSRTNPDNTIATYTFNNQGEIDSLTGVLSNVDYNAQGKITKKEFANGVATDYTYNTDDFRLTQIHTAADTASQSALLDNAYSYDKVGNVLSITDNLLSKMQSFTYDALDRLITASESAGYNYAYEYNAIGNLTKFTDKGTVIDYTYGLNAGPHALTGSTEVVATPTPSPTPTAGPTPTPTPTPTPPAGTGPVVQSVTSGNISSGGLTLTKPAGTVDGDLLIMTASADLESSENVTYTIPSGWTEVLANTRSDTSSAGTNLQVWYKIADNEPADYTITPDHSNLIGGSVIRITGHDASNPIDVDEVTISTTGEALAPSAATTIDDALVLRLVTWDQSKTVNSIPTGQTESYHVDVSGHDNWGGYVSQSAAGNTGIAQFDLSSGAPYVGYTLAIRPEGSISTAIQLDGAIQSTHNNGGNVTLSNFAVNGSNPNRFLLVAVGSHQGGGTTGATGVSYGGTAMTLLASAVGQYGEFSQLWGLQSPSGGSGNIVTSGVGGGSFTYLAAYSLYNVKQTYTVQSGIKSQGSNSSSITITPNSANNWIIDAIEAEPNPSVSGSNIQDWVRDGSNSYNNANGSRIVQSGGPTAATMSWSLSYGARSNHAVVALEPAASGDPTPTPTPTPTATPTPTPTPAPTYTGNGTVTPATLSEGETVTLNASFTNTSSYEHTARIYLQVRNPSDQEVYSRVWDNETFTAGQTKNYSTTWTIPQGAQLGTYIVKGGSTNQAMSEWYLWSNNLGTFTVSNVTPTPTPTATPTPTLTPTPTPVSTDFAGEYFNNDSLSGTPAFTRNDTTIDFDWGGGSPDAAIQADNFSARWTKTENFTAGLYTFTMTGDDGVRLYIDGTLVIDKWIDQGPTTYTTTKGLTAGTHTIKMEYYEHGGGAVAKFSYQGIAQSIIANGTYKLLNTNSGKALDVDNSGTTDGANVQIWTDNGSDAQKWEISQNSDGTYKLININSNKALDVAGAGTSDGTNVEIWTDNGGTNQKWMIIQNSDGTYKLIDANSSKALDVSSSGTSDGTNVQIWIDNGSSAQKWQLEQLSATPPTIESYTSGTVSSGGLTLNTPSGTVDGDLLIMTASADLESSENVTYTIPSGWTQLLANTRSDTSSAGTNLQVWYKIADNEPASYTITPDHDNLIGGSILRIDGHDPTNPFNITGLTASATGEASAPAVTTTVDNALILRLVTWDQSKTVNAIPTGHTQYHHLDVNGHDSWAGYKEQTTAGDTGVAQFDLSAASPYVGYTIAISPEILSQAMTINPTADTFVSASQPTTTYGSSGTIEVDGDSVKQALMKFDLTSLAGKTVTNATLRMYVVDGSTSTQNVKEVSTNNWSEATVTYNNRPTLVNVIGSIVSQTAINVWKEVDITNAIAARAGQTYSIGIDSSGTDGLDFNSKDNTSNKVELVITYQDENETRTLLSQGKSITASTQLSGYEATKANDGSMGSYWEGQSNIFPANLTVDLGAVYSVDKVVMKLNWGGRIENVEILGSSDNSTFTTLVPATNYVLNTMPVTFTPANVRYVRLKVNSNNSSPAGQMAEFEVWGQ